MKSIKEIIQEILEGHLEKIPDEKLISLRVERGRRLSQAEEGQVSFIKELETSKNKKS